MKPIIGITMGDPKGIGPEIIAKAWRELSDEQRQQIRIYGDRAALDAASRLVGQNFDPKHLIITSSTASVMGALTESEAARMTLAALDAAIADAEQHRIAALITGPVSKRRIQELHPDFLGHTEYLAQAAHARDVVMMFFSEERICLHAPSGLTKQLAVALVTAHIPLRDVPRAITRERVGLTIRRMHEGLEQLIGCKDGRIAVMALNPHAGEKGSMGDEEERIIVPAILQAQREGINCVGPIAADGLFTRLADFDYDAVVAMYHDQGLLPIKLLCQGKCVNVSLGLPYIRTSPGHGTAENIAWLGRADASGMIAAIRLTEQFVQQQHSR